MVALQKKVKNPSSNNLTFYQGDKVLVSLDSVGEKEDLEVDNILAMVGYRPDTSITEELQVRKVNYHVHLLSAWGFITSSEVHYCYATEGPMKLAAALMAAGGGGGDCLAQVFILKLLSALVWQVVPGPATLLTPEPGLLVLGMKSYGRGSAFLLR